MAGRNYAYQYETSPRKLKPEYTRPVRNVQKKKSTARKTTVKKVEKTVVKKKEVAKTKVEAKLDRISVTDHNTCLFHIINMFTDTTPIFSGEIIPGMECCSITNGATIDLLAYNFDVLKAFDWSFQTYGTLEIRQTKMKNMLMDIAKQNNFKINTDMIFNGKVDYAHKYVYNNLVQFPENAWLFEKYNICNFSDFYRASSINQNFPFYLQLENIWPSVKQVAEAIHNMGGIVILAHPYNYKDNISGDLTKNITNNIDKINRK